MTISVSSKTSTSVTVSCSYPSLTWYEGTPDQTKTVTVNSGIQIAWHWIWSTSTNSWGQNGWGHSAPDTYNYSDAEGYSNPSLPRTGVTPGTRTSPPSYSGTTNGQTATTYAMSGTATYSGTATKPGTSGYYTGATITSTTMNKNGSSVGSGSASNSFTYTFSGLTPNTEYSFSVDWYGNNGTSSGYLGSNSVSGVWTDQVSPPSAPTSLSGTPVSKSQIDLSWPSVSGATGYHVYRNSVHIASPTTTSYSDTGLSEYVSYGYAVYAYNAGGTSSGAATGSYRTKDETAPIAPIFSIINKTSTSFSVEAYSEDSHSGISYYEYYLDGIHKGTIFGSGWKTQAISGLSPNTTYTVTVKVVDVAGNASSSSTNVTTNPPPPPTGTPSVSASAGYNAGHYIDVSWTDVSSEDGYHIYANNNDGSSDVWKATVSAGTLSTRITVDSEYTLYTVKVVPYNSGGTGSTGSTNVRTLDVTAPIQLIASSSYTHDTITINADGDDNGGSGISFYRFYLNGVQKASITGTTASYTFTELTPATQYEITIVAVDSAGNYDGGYTDYFMTDVEPNPKPSNFSWQYSSIASGLDAIVDNRDWNNLAAKINEFRIYAGSTAYGFTTVSASTGDITAPLFNQLVNGANGVSAFMTNNVMPSTKVYGDPFLASYLNNIVTSINSVSIT